MKPCNIFSKADAGEQINVRIDDKINRIKRGTKYDNEDTELDLVGYLILKMVWRRIDKNRENKPLKKQCTCPDCLLERGETSDYGRILAKDPYPVSPSFKSTDE